MASIYLAGPMSGYPDHNRAAFARSAERLRRTGAFVLNPGTLNPDCDYRSALSVDLMWILAHAEVVALQEGWRNSPGAKAEHALAEALLRDTGKPLSIWYLFPGFADGAAGWVEVQSLNFSRSVFWTMAGPTSVQPPRRIASAIEKECARPDSGLDGIGGRVPPPEWG